MVVNLNSRNVVNGRHLAMMPHPERRSYYMAKSMGSEEWKGDFIHGKNV